MRTIAVTVAIAVAAALLTAPVQAQSVPPAEVRAIAKDAVIWGFPLVDSYRVQYSYFVDRCRRGIQGALEHAGQQRTRLYARRQGDPDAQFRHALFVRRRRPARRAAGDHGAGDRQGAILFDPVHRHVHVQLRLCGQPRDRQRRRQLPARRAGLERHEARERKVGDPLGDRVRVSAHPHAALQSGRHRQREEDPGGLQSPDPVAVPRQAGAGARAHHQFSKAVDGG